MIPSICKEKFFLKTNKNEDHIPVFIINYYILSRYSLYHTRINVLIKKDENGPILFIPKYIIFITNDLG